MTREERLELLKQIEKEIYVPSIESTFLDDAKSCAIHSAIEELEQEPRKGHWIRVDKDKLKCSKCDVIHFIAQYPQGKVAWCPNCGAKMVNPKECEKE